MNKENISSLTEKQKEIFQSKSRKDVIHCKKYLPQSDNLTYRSIAPESQNQFLKNISLTKRKSVTFIKSHILTSNEEEQKSVEILNDKLKLAKECYIRIHKNNSQKQKSKMKIEFHETLLNASFVKKYANNGDDSNYYDILQILAKPFINRDKFDNEKLLNFLLKTKIQEKLKTDLLISNLSIQKLYKYIMPYFSSKIYNFNDTIYYEGEESDNIYIILDGSVATYKIEKKEEILSCEEYYLYLADNYLEYKRQQKISYENKNEINLNEFIDEYLIFQIDEENKELYPLLALNDLDKMRQIIFKIKFQKFLSEKKVEEIKDLFHEYHYSNDYLNYNEVIESKISLSRYMQNLSRSFQKNEIFYKKLFSPLKHKVKLMKFIKVQNLEKYDYFGNFELLNYSPIREETIKCNSKKCLLLTINKKIYGYNLYLDLKKNIEKDLDIFHRDYLFKDVPKINFEQKIYSHFQINNFFKGQTIFNQNESINEFIFIKEGILEISLQNLSFNDLNEEIIELWNYLNKKAKEFKLNIKEFIDFDLVLDIDNKKKQKYKEVLNRKQNFILSHSEKGFFGGYETFFGLRSLITGTVVSDQCKIFSYNFEKYKKDFNEASFKINENLKNISFDILKNILERMITVYNSYWKLNNDHLNLENIEKENEIEQIRNCAKKKIQNNSKKIKNLFPTIKINQLAKELTNNSNNFINNSNEKENYISADNKYINKFSKSLWTEKESQSNLKINLIHNCRNFTTNLSNTKTYINSINDPFNLQKNSSNVIGINKNKDIENNLFVEPYYQKNLLKSFKCAMDAQHSKHKKEIKKIFCPPIIANPKKTLGYENFNDEKEDKDYNFNLLKLNSNEKKNKRAEKRTRNYLNKSENKKNLNLSRIEKELKNQLALMTISNTSTKNIKRENKNILDIKNAQLQILKFRRNKKPEFLDKKLYSETYNTKSIGKNTFKRIYS